MRRRVRIKHRADGVLVVDYQGQRPTCQELTAKPVLAKPKRPIVNNRRWVPSLDHPWNRDSTRRADPRVSLAPAAPARDLHAGKRKAG